MKRFLMLMTLIAVFVSCQKGSDDMPTPTLKRITITPTITRATEVSFEDGDKAGVLITKGDQSKHADNVQMTYSNGVFTGEVVWYEELQVKSQMIAYYPYNSAGVPTSFSVAANQSAEYSNSDLMGAVKSDVQPTETAVAMTFKHLLSKIVVNITQTDINIGSIVLQNSIPTAIVDLANLSVTADPSASPMDITAQKVVENSKYRVLIIPQTTTLTLVVTTTEGKTFTQKLLPATIENGGQYSINVEIAKEQMKVSMSGNIESWTDEGVIDEEKEKDPDASEFEIRTLTFEDADYKGTGNYLGNKDWSSLIDNPQYGGPLLYGDFHAVEYKWYDENNTFLASELPENYGGQLVYWGGGHAISNYMELDLAKGSHETQLAVYYKNATTSFGGHNGSKNFCVHFGYMDDSPFNQTTTLPSFYFKDGTARVVDHMYIMVTTYLANCIKNGNSLTDPCGPDDWIKIVATGYDAQGKKIEGNDLTFNLTTGVVGEVMSDWQKWDLSALGKVTRIDFNVTGSSDNGYGFSQPAYFAYDDVAVRFEK